MRELDATRSIATPSKWPILAARDEVARLKQENDSVRQEGADIASTHGILAVEPDVRSSCVAAGSSGARPRQREFAV